MQPGKNMIRIPKDSNKFWLTMFYILPNELVCQAKQYLDFPRCPHDVLRTDKYDDLINDDIFVELVFDCTAWSAWQMMEIKNSKGEYRPIPGSLLHYSGDFPIWQLCYAALPLIHRKLEQGTSFSFQSLARYPKGMEVPWLTYRQFGNLLGALIPQIVKEQNWQPIMDAAWETRTLEDYSTYKSRVKIDFLRQWTHSRTKAGASLSKDEMDEKGDVSQRKINSPEVEFEGDVLQRLRLSDFISTLPEKDQQIVQLKMEGLKTEEIAAAVGYFTHSAVVKRLQRIGEVYQEYTQKEYEAYCETF